jgi:cytochrome c-type biogenesis protein CcmF
MFVGFTGSAFNKDTTQEVRLGDHIRLAHYDLKVADLHEGDNDNYSWHSADIEASKDGAFLATMTPERRMYKASRQGTSEVAIRRRPNQDLYINFAGMSDDGQRAVIQAFVFPLVSWIWIGFWVVAFGTAICLVPSKVRYQYARTQVVGVTRKHAATVAN